MSVAEPYFVERVDTGAVLPRESADLWAEHVCRNQGTLQCRFASPSSFRGATAVQRYAGYQLIDFWSDSIGYSRTRADIRRDGDESLRVTIPTAGVLRLRQDGGTAQVAPGHAAVVTKTRPVDFDQPLAARGWVMNVPAGALPLETGAGPALIDLGEGLGSVVAGMIGELGRQREAVDGPEFASACDAIVDLLGLCLRRRSVMPTVLATVDTAVRNHVRRHADDPNLTPAAIARSLGWSLRQIQLALRHTGTAPSELIRSERLDRAHRRLREAPSARTVADIAYASGFRSLSAFGSAFKSRFGVTPQEVRPR
ncbi:AraC family transcriptional regulator [Nocardia niwae]|uniref:AraC family transcriptional regulator n=1 Tax=Nocardia niwae TaxID=626084 RepID=A0ABV2X6F4_9NOCA|nr:AraC family transcriptional regulator [Nocardia niwae]